MKRDVLFLLVVLLVVALAGCQQTTTSGGSGFVGGSEGVAIGFMPDAPPSEVYDGKQFPFEVAVKVQNKGESTVQPNDLKVVLSGISGDDFGGDYWEPNANYLRRTRMDSSAGNAVEGDTDYIYLTGFEYNKDIQGNAIPFKIRADVCYHYNTTAIARLCVRKPFTLPGEEMVCVVSEEKQLDVSGGPVKVSNFREMPAGGRDNNVKVAFSFDIEATGKGTFYKHFCGASSGKSQGGVCAGFADGTDTLCLAQLEKTPSEKLRQTNKINVRVDTGIGDGPACSGLIAADPSKEKNNWGDVQLHGSKRTITCTQDITNEKNAYEKPVYITLEYNYNDFIEAPLTVKHVGG